MKFLLVLGCIIVALTRSHLAHSGELIDFGEPNARPRSGNNFAT